MEGWIGRWVGGWIDEWIDGLMQIGTKESMSE